MSLFVAVVLPEAAAEHLAAALGRDPDRRWHLTLAFLREVADPGPVVDALSTVTFDPFRLALAGAGTFGGRVLWVDVGQGRAELSALAAAVRAVVPSDDRPYRPHLTVARGRDLAPGPLEAYAGPGFAVGAFSLVRSEAGLHTRVASFTARP